MVSYYFMSIVKATIIVFTLENVNVKSYIVLISAIDNVNLKQYYVILSSEAVVPSVIYLRKVELVFCIRQEVVL